MRRNLVLTILLATALLVPTAMAANGRAEQAKADAQAHRESGHATSDEHRPAWVADWHARMREIIQSFRENASSIRETCQAEHDADESATREDRLAMAHCIRDGYKTYFDELREARAQARAEMKEARLAWREQHERGDEEEE